jgi:hypothetical protein
LESRVTPQCHGPSGPDGSRCSDVKGGVIDVWALPWPGWPRRSRCSDVKVGH